MAALQFSPPQRAHFFDLADPSFSNGDWKKAVAFCDRSQLTLPLGLSAKGAEPQWVRDRFDRSLADNAQRWERIKASYRAIALALEAEGIESVVLKGFSHCPDFVSDPRHRPQFDIDLWLRKEQTFCARDIALGLGYEPLRGFDGVPIDHLPTMIRKTGWEWRGNYFDPEIPLALELHFRLWDEHTERFEPKGLEEFWDRREIRQLDRLRFTALHPVDAVAYSALHLLRHVLRGDVRPYHVYELAWLLEHKAEDAAFWHDWHAWHGESLRRLEAICFSLAHRWFDCRLSPAASDEVERLPSEVIRWLETHAFAPLASQFHTNKNELWLHWNLVESPRSRFAVLRRKLLPGRMLGPVEAVHLPEEQITWRIRMRRRWRSATHAASRLIHHSWALPLAAASAVKWFASRPD